MDVTSSNKGQSLSEPSKTMYEFSTYIIESKQKAHSNFTTKGSAPLLVGRDPLAGPTQQLRREAPLASRERRTLTREVWSSGGHQKEMRSPAQSFFLQSSFTFW